MVAVILFAIIMKYLAVASLGLVSPGAATDGVTFVTVTVYSVTPMFLYEKADDLFWSSLSLLLISLGCHPSPFLPIQPHLSTVFYKFSHKIFFCSVLPLEGVTRGGPPAPLVTTLIFGRSRSCDKKQLFRFWG